MTPSSEDRCLAIQDEWVDSYYHPLDINIDCLKMDVAWLVGEVSRLRENQAYQKQELVNMGRKLVGYENAMMMSISVLDDVL